MFGFKCKKEKHLHCLDAAKITRSSLSTRFCEIDGERSVNRGVTLLAPSSYGVMNGRKTTITYRGINLTR